LSFFSFKNGKGGKNSYFSAANSLCGYNRKDIKMIIGNEITWLNSVDSTNNYTTELLRQSVIHEGRVIVADEQTAGKGQRGNYWLSDTGKNLTFSVFIKPVFISPVNQFYLTKFISVALVRFLIKEGISDVYIKWPNDIYYKTKKIAGILIENNVRNNIISGSVIGIGLNVNQIEFPKILKMAGSMRLITGHNYNLKDTLQKLLDELNAGYLKLRADLFSFDDEYEQLLFRKNITADFLINNERVSGTIKGVDNNGLLILETKSGINLCNFKEIEFVI
jgi:BirA family transcriptional regulator, biotin operon repressor / biotin---[acetyl-CoA-carboxylase] ligase